MVRYPLMRWSAELSALIPTLAHRLDSRFSGQLDGAGGLHPARTAGAHGGRGTVPIGRYPESVSLKCCPFWEVAPQHIVSLLLELKNLQGVQFMGHVFTQAYVEGLKSGENVRMLVDTGATLAVIPRDLGERLGVPTLKPRKVKLADGEEVEAEAGVVHITINGREAPTTVLIIGEEPLLGVETLEILGLKVNPQTGELEPTRPYAVRA